MSGVPGFEDVDWQVLFWEMVKALPCLIVSLLLWWKILRNTDCRKVNRKKLNRKELKEDLKWEKIRKRIRKVISGLTLWKWCVGTIGFGLYLIIGIGILGNKDLPMIGTLGIFLLLLCLAGVCKIGDLENILLITIAGMLGCRHGSYFTGFNVFYPTCSLIIAVLLFLPGEMRALGIEKRNRIRNIAENVPHDRMVYFLSTGFLITSILYFLTSF